MTLEHEPREPSLRLFIAVELPGEVRAALAAAIDELKRAGVDRGLRWVRPEGIHLTLKFLGATPEAKVPAVIERVREAARVAEAFELQPGATGVFHGGKKAATFHTWRESYPHNIRVVFVAVGGETDALTALAAAVERTVAPLGFPTESRPFFAHLTLARMREDADRETREGVARALAPFLPVWSNQERRQVAERELRFPAFRVDALSLMQSTLQRGGAVYRALATAPLGTADAG